MFGESKFKFNKQKNVFLESNVDEFHLQIKQQANFALEENRPVLIFFKNNEELKLYLESDKLP